MESQKPKVKEYVGICCGDDPVLFCGWLDDFFRNVFHYRNEVEEIVRSPGFMLNDLETQGYMEGDCDDIATLAGCMLTSKGIPARFTVIQSKPSSGFDHVFCEARIGPYWVPMDPTVPLGTEYQSYNTMSVYV